jgi:hypothetical protein
VPEVDDDQLAALRRLRAAFGPIEIIAVTSNDPTTKATMPDTRRMTPEEHGEAHALLSRLNTLLKPEPFSEPPKEGLDKQPSGRG